MLSSDTISQPTHATGSWIQRAIGPTLHTAAGRPDSGSGINVHFVYVYGHPVLLACAQSRSHKLCVKLLLLGQLAQAPA